MSVKEQNKLSEEQDAVNQTLKNISEILDEAQKTTEGELSVTRIQDAIQERSERLAKYALKPNTITNETDIPAIVFSENNDNDKLVHNFARKIKKDRELTEYLKSDKKISEDRVKDLYSLVNSEADIAALSPRLSSTDPEVVKESEYEQTLLFKTSEADLITKALKDDALLEKISRESQGDEDSDDGFDNLSERILKSDISKFRGEISDTDQMKLILQDTAESETVKGSAQTLDATEINLRLAFNMLEEGYEIPDDIKNLSDKDVFKNATKKGRKEKSKTSSDIKGDEDEYSGYEYESHEQDNEVESILVKALKGWRIKTAFVFLLAAAIFFLELATKDSLMHPIFLKQGRYGMLYALVDLQLLLFITAIMINSVRKGIRDLFAFEPTSDSLLFIALLMPALHTIYCIIADPTNPALGLFNLSGAATAFFISCARMLQSKRDLGCFEIISDDRPKYAAESLKGATKEADEFYRYLMEDSAIYTVKRTDFISGFFRRIASRAKSDDLLIWQIIIVLISAVIMFSVSYIGNSSIFDSYKFTSALIATSLPITAVFASLLPTVKANKIARRSESALLGNAFTEEYDSAAVISFADTEVFPAANIKVTSLKTYGDYRIDRVIQDVAMIFETLGGPLSEVLSKVIVDGSESDSLGTMRFRLLECASDGLVVSSEGREFYIGRRSFMKGYMFDIPSQPGDAEFESGDGSIMYVGINEDLVAKFNLKYRINSRFNSLLKDMYKAGMCVGIKTLDPNINNEILAKNVSFKKCPIAILKADKPEDIHGKVEKISSAIATNGSIHTFLRMFILTDRTRHSIKSNIVLSMASMVLSIAIASFLVITGAANYLSSIYALLFQLLWLLPIGAMTYLT